MGQGRSRCKQRYWHAFSREDSARPTLQHTPTCTPLEGRATNSSTAVHPSLLIIGRATTSSTTASAGPSRAVYVTNGTELLLDNVLLRLGTAAAADCYGAYAHVPGGAITVDASRVEEPGPSGSRQVAPGT